MKKSIALYLSVLSFSALAAAPQFGQITQEDIKDISKEFGTNFSHTVVGAPDTNGLWGIELGVAAGQTSSKKFSKIVERSGGEAKDFKNIYHAGIFARAHLPFEIFLEATMLPEQKISDAKIKSHSFGLGWNAGNFFNLPLDIAIGVDSSKGNLSFKQAADLTYSVPASDIEFQTTTTNYWVGVSRRFIFVTPYLKVGSSSVDGDLKANALVFQNPVSQDGKASVSGTFLAYGVNFEFIGIRLGVEGTSMHNTQRVSGKLSYSF